jgi:hypothetical protein
MRCKAADMAEDFRGRAFTVLWRIPVHAVLDMERLLAVEIVADILPRVPEHHALLRSTATPVLLLSSTWL